MQKLWQPQEPVRKQTGMRVRTAAQAGVYGEKFNRCASGCGQTLRRCQNAADKKVEACSDAYEACQTDCFAGL